jgi:hypothetical protein
MRYSSSIACVFSLCHRFGDERHGIEVSHEGLYVEYGSFVCPGCSTIAYVRKPPPNPSLIQLMFEPKIIGRCNY